MNERRQLLIAGGAAALVAVLFFVLVLKPKMHELSTTKQQIASLQEEAQTLQNNLTRLQEIRREAPAAAAKLLTVSQLLPSTPDLPGFIRLIQDAATAAGSDLLSIAPNQPITLANATGVQTINVTVVVQAGFRRFEDFLTRLENLQRVVEISSMSLSPSVDPLSGQTTLTSTLTLQMFVVQDGAKVSAAPVAPAASPSPSASVRATP